MQLPDGEQLILTIDRVVETYCEKCNGTGMASGRIGYSGAIGNHCPACHGTGRIKVRLPGFVEVECSVEEYEGWTLEYDAAIAWFDHTTCNSVGELTDAIVAAYLKGELPDAIAANIEECVE